jgi:hypothetical protein
MEVQSEKMMECFDFIRSLYNEWQKDQIDIAQKKREREQRKR